ncbi:MAG: phosphoglucomutase/phosphomannomutase family protein [Halobacteriaceae archaeon]
MDEADAGADGADAVTFGTDGWRAPLSEFTTPRVRMVGQAVADHLADAGVAGPVAVGYDARESSPGFADALADVLAANGRDVLLARRDCPTPTVAWAVVERDLAGALMVTASHNPPSDNGVKFIPDDGAPALPAVTASIEARLAEPSSPVADPGAVRAVDFVGPHADHVLDLVGADLSGLSVVYDAMHGSGRGVTDALLARAGADVTRRRCASDPDFGGTSPEPSAENLAGLVEAVREAGADLGVANDGDADRVAVVTPGGFLDENLLFAALYDHLLADDAGPAVRSVSTTFLVDRVAAAHGETTVEVPVGFKWVAKAMAEHDALLGGEESGGFSVRGHVREKDGVLTALLAAAAAAEEPLEDRVARLLDEHGEVHQAKVSVDCPDAEKRATIDALADAIPDAVAGVPVESVNDADGFKLLLEDGSWVLVRPSGTEPKLRVYAEAESAARADELTGAGRDLVASVR